MANSDISGQITDGSGNPIGSAEVYLWREDLAGAGGVVAVTTADSSGNFAFTAHPDGSGSSESWHVAAKDPNASVQLQSAYGVTASPPTSVDSQFDVSITDTSPSPVAPGETLTVDASLSNSGTDSDTQTITLDIDNGVGQVDSSLEAARGGASKTVPLSWSVPSGQTEQGYQATVSSADDTASQTVTVASAVPASLVSHWTFDDADTNSGTAIDTVGSNDGTISGATTGVSGANETYATNEAYSFDGSGDGVDFGRVGDGLEAFSVAAWVNPDSLAGDASILIRDGGTKQTDRHWALRIDDSSGTVSLLTQDSSNTKIIAASSATISAGSWSHVVGTMGGTTATIYVDGTAEGSSTDGAYGVQPTSAQPAKAAGANPGGYVYYEGEIDDARFYDKELTSTEVSNLYNNGRI